LKIGPQVNILFRAAHRGLLLGLCESANCAGVPGLFQPPVKC